MKWLWYWGVPAEGTSLEQGCWRELSPLCQADECLRGSWSIFLPCLSKYIAGFSKTHRFKFFTFITIAWLLIATGR